MDGAGVSGVEGAVPPPLGPVVGPVRRTGRREVVLRVSRRTLWVGTAAVPLANVTWVDAFRYTAREGWVGRLLLWLGGALLVYAPLRHGSWWQGGQAAAALVLAVAGFAFGELYRRPRPVLAVETAAGSTVVVTLPDVNQLREIAGRIVHAIDHPEAEFAVVVRQMDSRTTRYGPLVSVRSGRRNRTFRL